MIVFTESRKNPSALQDATVTIEGQRVGEEIDLAKEIEGTEAQAGEERLNRCILALFQWPRSLNYLNSVSWCG